MVRAISPPPSPIDGRAIGKPGSNYRGDDWCPEEGSVPVAGTVATCPFSKTRAISYRKCPSTGAACTTVCTTVAARASLQLTTGSLGGDGGKAPVGPL